MERESQDLYRLLCDSSADMILLLDGAVIIDANPATVTTLGYGSVEELIGLTPWDISPEFQPDGTSSRVKAEEHIRASFESGSQAFDWVHKKKDGTPVYCQITITASGTPGSNLFLATMRDVTEHKRSEEALRHSEEKYRELVQTAHSIILRWDPEGDILFLNEFGQEFFGFSEEELLGKNVMGTIVAKTDTSGRDLVAMIDDILANPRRYESNINENIRKDGQPVWIAWTNKPSFDDKGHLIEILSVGVDVTERRQAQEALKESEKALRESKEMLQLVLDTIPVRVFWKDRRSVFLGCNQRFALDAGVHTCDAISGKTDFDLPWTSEESEAYRADDQVVIKSGVPKLNYEETQVNAEGNLTWLRTSKVPLKNLDGQVIGMLGTYEDITDHKLYEESLRESEERYRTIFNSNIDPFVLVDLEGYITDANPEAWRIHGYTKEEFIGLFGKDIIPSESQHWFDEFRKVQIGEWFRAEGQGLRKDGSTFDVDVFGTRIIYRGKEQLLGILRDVTERNRAREAMTMYADIVRNMQVGLYVYHLENHEDDRTLKLMAINPASTAERGLEEEKMVGAYIDELFPALRDLEIPQRFARVITTGEPFGIDDLVYADVNTPPKHYTLRAFCVPGDRVGVLFEDITKVRRAEEEKRQFYRETISSVTDGKLLIVETKETQTYAEKADFRQKISTYEDTTAARAELIEYARDKGLSGDALWLFMTGVGEAMTNAIKHARTGEVFAGSQSGEVWVGVSDSGSGMAALALPKATLRRGYSTKISMGMGYSIILDVADRTILSTGPDGTTVVMFKSLQPSEHEVSLEDIPDTWESIEAGKSGDMSS